MLYHYVARTPAGEAQNGSIEAASVELAIGALQRRNLIIVSLEPAKEKGGVFALRFSWFRSVKSRDVVILSRQLATLFEAKVPVVDALKVLATETENELLQESMQEILQDIQGGSSLSQAMARHPKAFSKFYVNMIRSGEESGKLEEVFLFLADYLERSYELTSRAKGALVYPAFILTAFAAVMTLMMVVVIPRLSTILTETGQALPFYTRMIIGLSDFLRQAGIFLLVLLAIGGVFLWRYVSTESGRATLGHIQLAIPYFGKLYKQLYVSRLADNLQTLLSGGVSAVRSLEIASDVIGNAVYRGVIIDVLSAVKSGSAFSEAFARHPEIPPLFSQMVRIGEETGKLDFMLKNLAIFYTREVENTVKSLVSLIEPMLIIVLGLGVGLLVAAIFVPIYSISTSI
ncbi:MAG: type II secretion system F family protein [Parcubacteria group bacterium]|nr:type II secretion system F family protein [Parcubacteria group bacterium]